MNDETKYRMMVAEKWSEIVMHIPAEIAKFDDCNKILEEMKDGLKSPALKEDVVSHSRAANGDDAVFGLAFNNEDAIEGNIRKMNALQHERGVYLMCCAEIESPLCELLAHRYVRREPWEDVADRIGYSADHCRGQLKSKAMLALYDLIPDEYMDKVNTP